MPVFKYQARDRLGKLIEGEQSAADAAAVKNLLFAKGLFPLHAEPKESKGLSAKLEDLLKPAPKPKDLANLTRQFEVMFSVGTQMDKILETLARQAQNKQLQLALQQIQRDIAGGMRLAAAFRKHPKFFNNLYCSMLEMGQAAGVLDRTLREMATILQKDHNIQAKVKSATLYPKIVIGALVGVSWAMLVFVFPPFAKLYAGQGAELPLPTQIMMALSTLVTKYWYLPIMGGIGLFVLWRRFKATDYGQELLSKLAFRLPVFGELNKLVCNARFGHLIAALYRAGLPLPQSLGVVADTMTNVVYAREVRALKEGIEHGKSLSQCMERTQYFSAMVKETCAVGEQTGKLDLILEATAHFYDGEVNEMLDNLTTLIEPILLFFLFGAVLFLALAVYLPIWNISKVMLKPH